MNNRTPASDLDDALLRDILSNAAPRPAMQPPQVRSAPLVNGAQSEPRTRTSGGTIVAAFAVIIGVPLWFEAARYTLFGWMLALDWFAARMSIPWQVPPIDWRLAVALTLAIGWAYSHVEARPPIRPPRNWRRDFARLEMWHVERAWQVWIVWLFLVATDIATTYVGMRARAADPSEIKILRDIAIAAGGPLAIYAILLTFAPDALVRFGWRALRQR